MKTLSGNGWLRESPKNLWPKGWDIKSRSALRKCVFLPVPPEAAAYLKALPPPKPMPMPISAVPAPIAHPRRSDPAKNARVFAAVSPEEVAAEQRKKLLLEARRIAMGKKPKAANDADAPAERVWYDDPIAIGTLLILVPPIGLAAIWTSKRYSSDARWALTVMTGLAMFLVAAVFIAITALRAH